MSKSNNMQQKQNDACHCYCKDLITAIANQNQLMTELIKQNNELIIQAEAREQFLLEVIEQNNELLAERDEDDRKPEHLDLDMDA